MDRKLEAELKVLKKMGLPDDIAMVVACAKFGKTDMLEYQLEEIKETQDELASVIKDLVPLEKTLQESTNIEIKVEEKKSSDSIEDDKDNKQTIQHLEQKCSEWVV